MSDSVVSVNGRPLSASEVCRRLGVAGGPHLLGAVVRRALVSQLAVREGISLAAEELQEGVDQWRHEHRLERPEDTHEWLERSGTTLGDVADHVASDLLEARLAAHVVGDRIQTYFAENRSDFDEAEVRWLQVSDGSVAEEIAAQVTHEGADFRQMALSFSEDEQTGRLGGFLGRIRRKDLPEAAAAKVFTGSGGEVIGPIELSGRYALYLVEEVYPAELTEGVRAEIRSKLFERWLTNETRKADIIYPSSAGAIGKVAGTDAAACEEASP